MNRAMSVSDLSFVTDSDKAPLRTGILLAAEHLDDVNSNLSQSFEVLSQHVLPNGLAPDRSGISSSLSNFAKVYVAST